MVSYVFTSVGILNPLMKLLNHNRRIKTIVVYRNHCLILHQTMIIRVVSYVLGNVDLYYDKCVMHNIRIYTV